MPASFRTLTFAGFAAFALTNACPAADWTSFRGPGGSSFDPQADPPVEFSSKEDKNIDWSAPMPARSVAGPLVLGDLVVTTSSGGMDNHRIYVTAVGLADGEQRWQVDMFCRGRPYSHPYSTNAAPTAASDGENIYAFFSSNDLVCLTRGGQLKWYRSLASDFPKVGNDVGMSSSPVVVDGVVVVQAESQGDAFIAGLDAEDGTLKWRVDRPRAANWASPVVARPSDGSYVLATSGEDVVGLRPSDGDQLFKLDSGGSAIASATASGDMFFIPNGGLTAYRYSGGGGQPEKLWSSRKLEPNSASPVVVGDKIWVIRGSVLTQGSVEDGEDDWKLRLPDAGGMWSTPVVAGDRLYALSDNGKCYVVKVGGEKGELLATSHIDDVIASSPALAGDALIIRGERLLWKVAAE